MSKYYKDMDKDDKKSCREKIEFLASIGFKELPDQPTPRLIHDKLPGEIFDVYDLNPLALVKKIYDLGEETVNEIIKCHRNQPDMTTNQLNLGGKSCSVCGDWFSAEEFIYGGRENRSYCKPCNKEARTAYRIGGVEAARKYRRDKRAAWKKPKS
ncbi:MAG TPA: hypothetical protein DER40_10370 [Geobacter sp.]|nr:MAG: hypothetical protein A2X85_10120 [Geobacteraceae bacterium GWF2_54_21]HCE67898.1 hypothetical protein [Geobacter sp.]